MKRRKENDFPQPETVRKTSLKNFLYKYIPVHNINDNFPRNNRQKTRCIKDSMLPAHEYFANAHYTNKCNP